VRDAEAAARASSLGPVRVRLHFPDGTLLQAAFSATDPLDKVLVRVKRWVARLFLAGLPNASCDEPSKLRLCCCSSSMLPCGVCHM
jgi:hypothetical protein